MEEIDITRRLRPQRPTEGAPPDPRPASVPPPIPVSSHGQSGPAAPAPPLPSATALPEPIPIPSAELHTIRFAAPTLAVDPVPPSHVPEPDPVTGWLVVIKGPGRGRSLALGYGIHPVGRAEDQRVPIRFGDKKISRRNHLEISYDERGRKFYIGPGRGSTLGYLNDQPVLQPVLLQAGDRITVGNTELVFVPFCGESFDWQHDE